MLVLSILTALITIIGCYVGNGNFWGYYPPKVWSRIFCFVALCPVKATGHENIDKNKSYVFVANHQGAFDIFLIYGFLNHNFKWMMKQSLRKMPLIGKACESAGHIMVDDSGARGVKRSMNQSLETLKHGQSLVIFPEGSRTLDGKIHRFKRGAFNLACDNNLEIVPITIEGPYKIMRRGTLQIFPHKLKMTIHKPISSDIADRDERAEYLKEKAFEIISKSL